MHEELLHRNAVWANERTDADPEYFKRLAAIQRPEYLWIGCADSRVPANVITGLAPGEVFVHRNIANLLHPSDLNALSVLQYAVEVLKVRYIIVCGHYGCGGVKAADEGRQHGLIDYWLEPIRDVARSHAEALAVQPDETARHDMLCELNVAAQVERVADTPIVRSAWAAGQELIISGWIYSLKDGLLRDLACTRSGPLK